MWVKRICKTGLMLFLFIMVLNLFSLKSVIAKAETVAEHEIFQTMKLKKQ